MKVEHVPVDDSGEEDDLFLGDMTPLLIEQLSSVFDIPFFQEQFAYATLGHGTTFYWMKKIIMRIFQTTGPEGSEVNELRQLGVASLYLEKLSCWIDALHYSPKHWVLRLIRDFELRDHQRAYPFSNLIPDAVESTYFDWHPKGKKTSYSRFQFIVENSSYFTRKEKFWRSKLTVMSFWLIQTRISVYSMEPVWHPLTPLLLKG